MITSQRQVVEQLKTGLQQMEVKLGELKSRRDQLVARKKSAEAQVRVQGAIRSINVLDPTSELARYEDQVRRVEAQAAGQTELAGSSLEAQFAELEASSAQTEAEARLAALKAGGNRTLPEAASPAQITDGQIDAAFAALIALFISGLGKDPQELPSVTTGKALPAIDLPALESDQQRHTSADLPQGEPYLLNIWGSWCPACRVEHSYLIERSAQIPIIGVNIGKTKIVELENAIEDYLISTRTLAPQADYLVVNVSSPNTPGLRTLQSIATLRPLLQAVREEANRVSPHRHVPLTVKIAPDLVDEDITAVARLAQELKLDGIIATNTTIAREGLGLHTTKEKINAIGAGGLSGEPLKTRSLEVLHLLKKEIGNKLALISVGGVTNAQDVQERLDAGADLVQGYTAFLYEGPLWAAHINRGLYKIRRSHQK